ncbi:DUF1275 family protein, partial [Acinetobacter baumannii]
THLGVSLAEAQWRDAANAAGLISLFVAGATLGSVIMRPGSAARQSLLLLVEGTLLVGASLCHLGTMPSAAIAAIVLAMGLENAAFQVKGGGG